MNKPGKSFHGRDNPSLKRPRPDPGFRDWHRLQRHASHSEPNMKPGRHLMRPSIHNNALAFGANANATYPFFAGAFSNDWQTEYHEAMPMFMNMMQGKYVKQTGEFTKWNDPRTTLTGRHTTHQIMASLPVLNFYLTIGSCDPGFVQRFVKRYQLNEALIPHADEDKNLVLDYFPDLPSFTEDSADISKPEYQALRDARDDSFIKDFIKKWRFSGVILTDMDVSSRFQKLFNLNVRGRTNIFNLWTTRLSSRYERKQARDRVKQNDTLYFVLKKVPVDETTWLQPDGSSMSIIPEISDDQMVWQLRCARMSMGKRPVINPGENVHYIEVGRVLNSISKKPDEHYQRRAYRIHKQMMCLPQLEIVLKTGMM